ncbi:MAG: hypothetical protein GF317_05480 [Candidatus Lokiarchaeota archaeon]|nr:hypothetical protein [Candidatus Lokiarchaeota archaeon]MBD3199258.1 hypothetical protein [Candidatus Lokiarchaeota archaeon]
MNENQQSEKIKEVAMELDDALEMKDYDLIKKYFSDDCEIELLGETLRGKEGVKNWLDFIFSYVKTFKLVPIIIMVQDDIFFEEFEVIATLNNGSELQSKWAEILEYENYKIKSLRLYFDRLIFAKSAASNSITRKILGYIDKKTLEGLK